MSAVTEKPNLFIIPKETVTNDCERIESYTNLGLISSIGITAIGFLAIYLGAPVAGLVLIGPAICGSLLSNDIKHIAQFVKTQEPYVLHTTMPSKEYAIAAQQYCDIVNTVLVSQSPIGKILLDIYKESLQGFTKIHTAYGETAILSCAKNDLDLEVEISNFDKLRNSMENYSRVISDIAIIVIGLSAATLAVASFSLYRFYPLSSLLYIPFVMSSLPAVDVSLAGLVLGYDIKRFSSNLRNLMETDELRNLTQESAGWKLVGLSKASGYHSFSSNFQELEITQAEIQTKIDQSANDATQLFKDTLLKRLSPLGNKFIVAVSSRIYRHGELTSKYMIALVKRRQKNAIYDQLFTDLASKKKSLAPEEINAAQEQLENAFREYELAGKASQDALNALNNH